MRRRLLLLAAMWIAYTYGHSIGWDRAKGRRPMVARRHAALHDDLAQRRALKGGELERRAAGRWRRR